MKSILLTTTALVVFAGAATAGGHTSISHSFSGTLGYNDTDSNNEAVADDTATTDVDETVAAGTYDNELGFYWEGNLTTTATAALDNGLTAGAQFEITINEDDGDINNDNGLALSSSDFVLSLTSETSGLYFGDTGRAAEQHWKGAGDMEADGVSTGSDSAVLRGDVAFGPVDASVSYLVNDAFDDDGTDPNDALEQLSVGAAAEFGDFFATVAYQEETDFADSDGDFNGNEVIGISAGGTFAGATVTVAYAETDNAVEDDTATTDVDESADAQSSTGIKVAYPFGPVTATAYFVAEEGGANDDDNSGLNIAYADGPISGSVDFQDDQGTTKWAVNASYDVGNGLTIFGGFENDNEEDTDYHVGGKYDLGGGASLQVTYAEDDDMNQEDEIGSGDYQEGTTVELSMSF